MTGHHSRMIGLRGWKLTCTGVAVFVVNTVCTQPAAQVQEQGGGVGTSSDRPSSLSHPKDNSTCVSCHQNLAKEDISRIHQRHRVLCVDCHGSSEEHSRDGKSEPGVTFARSGVEPFCQGCHRSSDHPDKRSFIEKWQGRTRSNGQTITATSICTDCHGVHVVQR